LFNHQAELNATALSRPSPLFRAVSKKTKHLTGREITRIEAYRMVKRRARAAGILSPIGCHTFRATGITQYLKNGGKLEHAQQIAVHESPRTTKLYDRREDEVTLDEVEKIVF
jgi:integrase/recombinase XerD